MTLQGKQLPGIATTVGAPTPPSTPGGAGAPGPRQMAVTQTTQTFPAPTTTPPPQVAPLGAQPTAIPGSPPTDADPATVDYYEVKVDTVLQEHQVTFVPGRIYKIAPHIYLDTCDDGSKFADHCTIIAVHPKAQASE